MKLNPIARKRVLSVAAFIGLSMVAPLMGQIGKVEHDKPEFDNLPSPNFGGNTGKKNFKPKDWLEAEVKFKVEMPKSYTKRFVDQVVVKWFVAAQNPDGKGFVLLEKEITHVNVPVGEEVFTSVYLSPASIMRLSGSDRASKSVIKSVGGEILVNGQPSVNKSGKKGVAFSSTGQPGWWTAAGMSRNDSIPLRDKDETPFKALWYDRYAEIEQKR